MRVGVDATPLLGPRTGIGRYVEHLVGTLAGEVDLRATAFTWRGQDGLRGAVPPEVPTAGRRAPARALQSLWTKTEFPKVEWLAGKVDVFHGTNFVLPPARRAGGVLTVHDLAYLKLPEVVNEASLRYRELVPRSLRRAAVVCTPSYAVAEELVEAYRLSPDKVLATPLGVDRAWLETPPPDLDWLAARGLPGEYLLAVGTLEPRKGLDVLVAAYKRLLAEQPDTPPLVLVGGTGWGQQPDLAALPPGRLITPGYLDNDDLRRVVAGALLLAFPSRYEGFGLPTLEALAAGVPVVASDLPAVAEATGGHARLVPAGDADALAGALASELDKAPDPDVRAAGRAHAAAHTWRTCADLTLQAYERAAG